MTNPTINVNLSSLAPGTVPTVTQSVEVSEGAQLDVNVTWPSDAVNTITVDLDFSQSGNQDPFNDDQGGDTTFDLTRNPPSQSATQTLTVQSDATVTSDVYDLTLTINGQTYSTDPTIIIDPD
ncbi:hypothetical protein [Marinicella litoralis]|uniref:Uncharacterized protein n=1 Tax=Marinicella litoralis TaxID=644220 RepID=A0A4R6XJP2_9GAMM|nr:hypothetical protein [Marinicella litoralis]TDR17433.1 hypothetical protein C8D91_2491 [Marinicella litoralis]